jgi:hypothetical protein
MVSLTSRRALRLHELDVLDFSQIGFVSILHQDWSVVLDLTCFVFARPV